MQPPWTLHGPYMHPGHPHVPMYTQARVLTLSRIFLWFASDFGGHAGVPRLLGTLNLTLSLTLSLTLILAPTLTLTLTLTPNQVAGWAARAGSAFVDAPVSGGVGGAEQACELVS